LINAISDGEYENVQNDDELLEGWRAPAASSGFTRWAEADDSFAFTHLWKQQSSN